MALPHQRTTYKLWELNAETIPPSETVQRSADRAKKTVATDRWLDGGTSCGPVGSVIAAPLRLMDPL
jgi:hypothetical protein